MTTKLTTGVLGASLAAAFVFAPPAGADTRARLDGYQENPSVSTDATGSFRLKTRRHEGEIEFTLSYAGIETPVRFAHIHFARRHVNGGVVVWLCDNLGASPIAVPPCPEGAGSVSGTIDAASVTGAASQGIGAGDLDGLLEAIDAGAAYVNVHSIAFPGGELRGQIRGRGRDHD